jgi:hypothetical protein
MRDCPTPGGSAPPPLITHRIGGEVCLLRQRTFFHKCHRCIYRGHAADWEPEAAPVIPIEVHVDEEEVVAAVKTVAIPHPNGVKKTGKSRQRQKRPRLSSGGASAVPAAAAISLRGPAG